MQIDRRTLFESELVQVAHVRARPAPDRRDEPERQSANVLVLPLAGVFAKHDGPRRQVLATANHAVFIPVATSYRISLPSDVGDACLTLRFSPASLAQLAPAAMSGEGFDTAAFRAHTLLPAELMLARSVLWHRLAGVEWDALEVEEIATGLLVSALRVAQHDRKPRELSAARRSSSRSPPKRR
ncbi:MAG TPA: hypothetical protein VFG30_21505 [Polyangiales bacterium]|nr:hypothetical protein [Polyangiales bacterium]